MKMIRNTVSTYQRDDLRKVGPSFIPSEEVTLLRLARSGDPSAFESLVLPHWRALFRVAHSILRNREDAEDAVQNALLDAFRNLKGFQSRSRFSTWLTRITKNAALMRLRVNRREQEISLDEVTDTNEMPTRFHPVESRPNPEQQYLLDEGRELLQKGIGRLDPLYAEVLHLRSVGELSAKEAAGLLEVPVGTVKARLHRARVKLIRYTQKMLRHQWRVYPVKTRYVGMLISPDSPSFSRMRRKNAQLEGQLSMNTRKKTPNLVTSEAGPTDPIGSPYEPTLEEIQARAYESYVQRGRTDGFDLEDWLQAEKELKENGNKRPS